eukprot:766210-Hanusia_phi.AAC.7
MLLGRVAAEEEQFPHLPLLPPTPRSPPPPPPRSPPPPPPLLSSLTSHVRLLASIVLPPELEDRSLLEVAEGREERSHGAGGNELPQPPLLPPHALHVAALHRRDRWL